MKKVSFIVGLILLFAGGSYAQTKSQGQSLIGKAQGAANQCIAGENNVQTTVIDRCPVDGNIIVSFNQYWSPPKCPPGQSCPELIPPAYDYVSIARVIFDCNENVVGVDCEHVVVFEGLTMF